MATGRSHWLHTPSPGDPGVLFALLSSSEQLPVRSCVRAQAWGTFQSLPRSRLGPGIMRPRPWDVVSVHNFLHAPHARPCAQRSALHQRFAGRLPPVSAAHLLLACPRQPLLRPQPACSTFHAAMCIQQPCLAVGEAEQGAGGPKVGRCCRRPREGGRHLPSSWAAAGRASHHTVLLPNVQACNDSFSAEAAAAVTPFFHHSQRHGAPSAASPAAAAGGGAAGCTAEQRSGRTPAGTDGGTPHRGWHADQRCALPLCRVAP